MSLAATAYSSTSGWLLEGITRAGGAMAAAPKTPNFSGKEVASLSFRLLGAGGLMKAYKENAKRCQVARL
jgi:hypothetical protein